MIERKADRRRSVSSYFTRPQADRRRGVDRRACAEPLTWVEPQPGAVRSGPGEAVPAVERRRFADAGME